MSKEINKYCMYFYLYKPRNWNMFPWVLRYLFIVFAVEVLWADLQCIWEINSRLRPWSVQLLILPHLWIIDQNALLLTLLGKALCATIIVLIQHNLILCIIWYKKKKNRCNCNFWPPFYCLVFSCVIQCVTLWFAEVRAAYSPCCGAISCTELCNTPAV